MRLLFAGLMALAVSSAGAQAAGTTCTQFRKAYSNMMAERIKTLGPSSPQKMLAYTQAIRDAVVDMRVYMPDFTVSASAGCLEAQVFLGSVLVSGLGGLPPDHAAALHWFTLANDNPRSATSVYAQDIRNGLAAAQH